MLFSCDTARSALNRLANCTKAYPQQDPFECSDRPRSSFRGQTTSRISPKGSKSDWMSASVVFRKIQNHHGIYYAKIMTSQHDIQYSEHIYDCFVQTLNGKFLTRTRPALMWRTRNPLSSSPVSQGVRWKSKEKNRNICTGEIDIKLDE